MKKLHPYGTVLVLLAGLTGAAHGQVTEKTLLASPVNGSGDQPLAVTLQWNNASGASGYQVQVSEVPDFSPAFVDQSGISGTSFDIGPLQREKKYYWRVRGSFLSIPGAWSDTWNFTTIPEPPTVPVLTAPADNAIDRPTSLTLSWNASDRAAAYRLQLAGNAVFTQGLRDTTVTTPALAVANLARAAEFFWRVSSSNSGGTSNWSSVFRFTTVPYLPAVPSPVTPADNAVNQPVTLQVSWQPAMNASSYHLQASLHSGFSSFVFNDSLLSDTTAQLASLLRDTSYYWRIRSLNSGGTSGWSAVRRFATLPAAPAAPQLSTPIDDDADQTIPVVLRWSPVKNATSYIVHLSLRSDFSVIAADESISTETTFAAGELLYDTTYYWRTAAVNSGGQSVWSAVWSFATIPQQPVVPTAIFPAVNAYVDTTRISFSWNAVPRASSYAIQVATDSSFDKLVVDDSAIAAAAYTVSDLSYNKEYFWRIRSRNAGGNSPWSNPHRFITRSQDSYAGPELESPANGAADQPRTLTVRWKPVVTALAYQIQVSQNESFSSTVFDNSHLLTSTVEVGPLEEKTTYYWRVRSDYLLFTSEWSSVWHFTTVPGSPLVPALAFPLNNAVETPTTVVFRWSRIPSAATYHFQAATDPLFASLIVNDAAVTDTVCRVESLAHERTFYWRVAAINNGGKSAWSQVWSFSTVSALPPPPVPLFPPSGSALDTNAVTISWNEDPDALTYWLQLAGDSGFASIVFNDSTIEGTSRLISGLKESTLYYWRVCSEQPQSRTRWSSPNSFTTGSASTAAGPALISPPDNAADQPVTVTLQWAADAGAISYHVQVSENFNFSPVTFENNTVSGTSVQTTGLKNGTVYYWRVRTNYLLVSSDWSSIWSLTTVPAVPAAPVLVSPPNGSVNQPLTPTMKWTTQTGTVRRHLQIAVDSLFASPTKNDSTLTADSVRIGPLTVDRTYFWRVRTGSSARWGPFSSISKFRTKSGDLPAAATLTATNITATSAVLNAVVSANGYTTTARFQYGTTPSYGNSVDGIPLTIEDTATFRGITNTLHGLHPNTQYHYRVSTTNQLGSTEGEDRSFRTLLPPYPEEIIVNTTFDFPLYRNPSDYKPTDYRIIGLPGNSNMRSDSLLSQFPRNEWEMYWDMGSDDRTLVPFDGSSNFSFTTGRAFWFIKKGPLSIQRTIPSAPLDSTQMIRIPVHPGWNLITNPFDSVILWQKVQEANSFSQPIFAFEGNFFISDTLRPHAGYYFFNDTTDSSLRIPYAALFESNDAESSPMPKNNPDRNWEIVITMKSGEYEDNTTWLGVGDGSPGLRLHKPAGFAMIPAVYFDRPEWDERHRTFATDYRTAIEHSTSWELTVWHPAKEQIELSFFGIRNVPARFDLYVIDVKAQRTVNLRTDSVYRFIPAGRKTTVRLLVGTPDSIRNIVESVGIPSSFSIGYNYPNPFNPETTIPVAVPFRSDVEVTVVTMLGQKIRTLYAGMLEPGRHWLRWDGKNNAGMAMSSGVYFCHLQTPYGNSVTRKMILTK